MTRCTTLPPCTAEAAHHGLAAIRDWLELASFAATTIGVVFLMAGAVFAASQLREATKVRRAQLYTDIRNRWIAQDLREARKLVKGLIASRHQADVTAPAHEAAYSATLQDGLHLMRALNALRAANSADFEVAPRIPSFIEDVGVLCRRGISIPEDVFDLMGSSLETQISWFLPYIISRRQAGSSVYANTLWLYRKVQARQPYTELDQSLVAIAANGEATPIRSLVEQSAAGPCRRSDRVVAGGVGENAQGHV